MEEYHDKSNMPNFLIIGLARSGTSSLFNLLGQHPQIFTTTQRVPNFFGLGEQPEHTWNGPLKRHPNIVDSYEEYLQLYSGKGAETRWGEGSSFFNFTIRGLERIHQYTPQAKLILQIRNPVSRSFSQFTYARYYKWEPRFFFKKALAEEPVRKMNNWYPFLLYRESGLMSKKLEVLYRLFSPDQLFVGMFDDYVGGLESYLKKLYSFLDVDCSFTPQFNVSPNKIPFSWRIIEKKMPTSIKKDLYSY